MSHHRHTKRLVRALTAVLAALAVSVGLTLPAAAAEPTPAGKAVILAEPGVVFVETSVQASVRMATPDGSTIDRTYESSWSSGSGFVVNPNGAVVTASHVIEPDEQELRNYAVNRLFFEDLGEQLGVGLDDDQDLTVQYDITDDEALNARLHECYQAIGCEFANPVQVKVYTPGEIAGQRPTGLPAQVVHSTGFASTDVAVLQVQASNLPTVTLADSASALQTGDELVALGFAGSAQQLPTGVTEPTKAFGRVSNVREVDGTRVIQADFRAEGGMSGGPVIGADGRVVGLESFTLENGTGQSGQEYVRMIEDIRAALAAAGVTPAGGQADTLFRQAMTDFWAGHYSAAAPALRSVLALHGGHPLARRYLAEAEAKAGSGEDVPVGRQPSRRPAGLVLVMAVVLGLGMLTAGAYAGRGQRRRSRSLAAGPALEQVRGDEPVRLG
jgi:S1-C subfamily serine protease